MLKNFLGSLSLSPYKSDVWNKWFTCAYQVKNKLRLLIEKLIKRFQHDENGPIAALNIDCLKAPIGSGNIVESMPLHLPHDIGVFPFQDIFYGLIEVFPMNNGRWSIPELSKIRCFWKRVITIDRNKLSQTFYASQQSNKL